ncbi:MAG TPA: nucleotidyltransferase domain-containing protein, partial [Aminobacteriaceae bacterium]|nr:nucleotidyltransferase domain-containing protein [Aminobacteriaceae bacterium]
ENNYVAFSFIWLRSEKRRLKTPYAIIGYIGKSVTLQKLCRSAASDESEPMNMLREESLRFIRALAEEYGAARVFLFGSCLLLPQEDARDIDLAVEGISEEQLDAFWDRLMWADALGRKPVDVLRLEDGHWLNPIILDEGVLIYEAQLSPIAL